MNRDPALRPHIVLFVRAEKLIPLAEYVKSMQEDQKYIYYACGESVANLSKLPQAEPLRDKGYEILYLTEDVDEFRRQDARAGSRKRNSSPQRRGPGSKARRRKKATEQLETEYKDVLDFVKESLGRQIAAAKLSHKLKSSPVCHTTPRRRQPRKWSAISRSCRASPANSLKPSASSNLTRTIPCSRR